MTDPLLQAELHRELRLTCQTNDDLLLREAVRAKLERAEKANALSSASFTLTGSDRTADVLESLGQRPLWEKP